MGLRRVRDGWQVLNARGASQPLAPRTLPTLLEARRLLIQIRARVLRSRQKLPPEKPYPLASLHRNPSTQEWLVIRQGQVVSRHRTKRAAERRERQLRRRDDSKCASKEQQNGSSSSTSSSSDG